MSHKQVGLHTLRVGLHTLLGWYPEILWENLRWYLQIYGLVSILVCLQKSTRLCHGRKKDFKDLEDLLVF
jgi:hypothetical protein